jgi:hypothetical protein
LTGDALADRGSRMVLRRVTKDGKALGFVIARDDHMESGRWWSLAKTAGSKFSFLRLAESYTLNYLLKIGRGNRDL